MKYISVGEFAGKYGVSERTARNYCAVGKIEGAELKHTKTPKKLTFEEREKRMLDYLERNKRITTPDYAGLNGCSRYRATADLKLFTEKNVVSKIGGGTHVMYVLPADNEETK